MYILIFNSFKTLPAPQTTTPLIIKQAICCIMNHLTERLKVIIGLIIISIPVVLFVLWAYACQVANGYPENVKLYNSFLPESLRGNSLSTILSIVFCIIAISLNTNNLKNPNLVFRLISWIIVIVGSLIGFLNIFSMM
jgi:F0F1-type ATP synthase assembly protein I